MPPPQEPARVSKSNDHISAFPLPACPLSSEVLHVPKRVLVLGVARILNKRISASVLIRSRSKCPMKSTCVSQHFFLKLLCVRSPLPEYFEMPSLITLPAIRPYEPVGIFQFQTSP